MVNLLWILILIVCPGIPVRTLGTVHGLFRKSVWSKISFSELIAVIAAIFRCEDNCPSGMKKEVDAADAGSVRLLG